MDMTSIAAAITSLNAAKEIAKAFVGVRDAAIIQGKVIELQTAILDAQSSAMDARSEQLTLIEKINALEAQIAQFKKWEAEKQRYCLVELRPGAFAYALKEEARAGEPIHNLCQTCYEAGKKSVLQEVLRFPGRTPVLVCHYCGSEIYLSGGWHPSHGATKSAARSR